MPFISSVRGSYGAQGRFGKKAATGVGLGSTGGATTVVGEYRYHAFTSVGNTSFTAAQSGLIDVLVVGGGGASSIQHSGGAGAGGLIFIKDYAISSGSYGITVGNGATVTSNLNSDDSYRLAGANGSNSVFGILTALGGGGARPWGSGDINPGSAGGSGGSGWNANGGAGTQPSQSGLSGQYGFGNNAGNGSGASGGGAGSAGRDGNATLGGDGKYIAEFSQFGVSGFFAGGGGGGNSTGGPGGSGGGGGNVTNSQSYPPSTGNGVANTGGGGGGCADNTTGGNGGSGVVLVRYQI